MAIRIFLEPKILNMELPADIHSVLNHVSITILAEMLLGF